MRRYFVCMALAACVCAWGVGCGPGTVELRRTRAGNETVTLQKLDAKIFDDRESSFSASLSIGLPGGVSVAPGVQFGRAATMKWNESVAKLIAQYKLLIADHNGAKITWEEYVDRRRALDELLEAVAFGQPVTEGRLKDIQNLQTMVDASLEEMDAELAKIHGDAAPAQRKEELAKLKEQAPKEIAARKAELQADMGRVEAKLKEIEDRSQVHPITD